MIKTRERGDALRRATAAEGGKVPAGKIKLEAEDTRRRSKELDVRFLFA
jgi:hypothetical protein